MGHRIRLTDLSPAFQRQAAAKWLAAEQQGRRKYHNTPTEVNGIRFDSRKEAERYYELLQAQKAGSIRNLRLQPQFTLVEGYKDAVTGKAVRSLRYIADFQYEQCIQSAGPSYKSDYNADAAEKWETVVEDTKGRRTRDYINKKKLMFEKFGIRVKET